MSLLLSIKQEMPSVEHFKIFFLFSIALKRTMFKYWF